MKIINGDNCIAGRIASHAAKAALLGNEVVVVNCDKIVITGDKRTTIEKFLDVSHRRGKPVKGPFYHRRPDMFMRRMIRRMLPKNARGIIAFKRTMCYVGVPPAFTAPLETIQDASVEKIIVSKYITIAKLCQELGGRW
ncbi:MAG TPA: 50S ribosomal protein L13 [Candidatus Nanoarchaeia archaeon]|nr:50S ribosomal protein L13 [Candidatus Nanoarchaeia archaeon]